jgi:hypothetical protein
MKIIKSILHTLSSLKITLVSLFGLFLIILVGTFAQVDYGIHYVQETFFRSFIIWKTIGSLNIPILPGGYVFGGALLINLVSFFCIKLKWSRKNSGIVLIHTGLLLLLIGSGLTGILSVESQLTIEEGQTKNYSEDFFKKELVIITSESDTLNNVTSIPFSNLKEKDVFTPNEFPFSLTINSLYKSATIVLASAQTSVTTEVGQYFQIVPFTYSYDSNSLNNAAAIVEIKNLNGESATLLLSEEIQRPQNIQLDGIIYSFEIRRKRYYTPYTLTLNKFTHDTYLGTNIPKNFASNITLYNPLSNEERSSKIYMNNPLRYDGKTYFQASFGKNDSVSIFQVVENPTWLWPYISTLMMSLGLAIHFMMMFIKRAKKHD